MADLLLVSLLLVDVYMIGTSRLAACIRASALQGLLLAALPLFFHHGPPDVHLVVLVGGALLLKALVIPRLLLRTLQTTSVRREVEPMVSLHASLIELGILLDVWVGVFVIGIAIHHIDREFDHIDTDRLVELRG